MHTCLDFFNCQMMLKLINKHQRNYISVSIYPICEHLGSAVSSCNMQGVQAILTTILGSLAVKEAESWWFESESNV